MANGSSQTSTLLRVWMLGEIYGKAGRKAVAARVPRLRTELEVDLVIANGESAAGGYGLTANTAAELFNNGIDVITSGSRIFEQREMVDYLKSSQHKSILRPLNFPPGVPGVAFCTVQTGKGPVTILNLNGKVYFNEMDSPFRVIDAWLSSQQLAQPLLVDFHAEATSEKVVMGWFLAGRASAVLGTHLRTPTADARLLTPGTAFVSDVGMIGPYNSVTGLETELAIKPFVEHLQVRAKSNSRTTTGPVIFNSVLVEIEITSKRAVSIKRFDLLLDDDTMSGFA
jgi:metallophosphoesterase (TIGR00282 family)